MTRLRSQGTYQQTVAQLAQTSHGMVAHRCIDDTHVQELIAALLRFVATPGSDKPLPGLTLSGFAFSTTVAVMVFFTSVWSISLWRCRRMRTPVETPVPELDLLDVQA